MNPPVIRVRNLSKLYRLGEVGTGSLAHDVNRWWHRARGREDPYARIGQVNDRARKTEADWVWALKDINFEVRRGEVLGIIGRNGAGKSTLLKILSRVTAPSTGEVKVKGRIASLLEVGTGFHPELTGRENVYLNGSILGMRKREIDRKLDEIVDFSGCAAYLDTPVKRYSSGMQVRLAFAVAAHLEPEILVVDEVLAVGDAEFQQKCLGKLRDVAGSGARTVLFVSHNMQAISELCHRVIMIAGGSISADGNPDAVIGSYLGESSSDQPEWSAPDAASSSAPVSVLQTRICDERGRTALVIPYDSPVFFEAHYRERKVGSSWVLAFGISDQKGQFIFWSWDVDHMTKQPAESGTMWKSVCRIPDRLLMPGRYHVTFSACEMAGGRLTSCYEHHDRALSFEVSPQGFLPESRGGVIAPGMTWNRTRE
ncbi:MAG TPA: ABC transporter ATP-binding protein [Verrucomicrobiaceae bacterium]|jgi:lipopolysaccharide transport system ATP-binding protein